VDALLAANPGIEPGTLAGDELDVLIDLIEHYESKQETFATPSALSAIAFRMEQAGLKPRDLIPFIGSRAKVSEVLSGKRPITLPMARALHKNLGIPADLLLADEPDDQETREWDRFPITALRHIGVITNKAFKSAEEAVRDLMKRAQCIDPLPMYRRRPGQSKMDRRPGQSKIGNFLQALGRFSNAAEAGEGGCFIHDQRPRDPRSARISGHLSLRVALRSSRLAVRNRL